MTDHAPSVVAPATDAVRFLDAHEANAQGCSCGYRFVAGERWLHHVIEAALRAESVAAPPDPTVCEVCGKLADGEPGRCHLHFRRHALHAPPALDAARLASAMDDAWRPGDVFVDDHDGMWVPFAERVIAELRAVTPASGEPAAPREEQP